MIVAATARLWSCCRTKTPTSQDFGTPLGDATRRDFTINAMFFNVNTRQIEDFTNMVRRDDLCDVVDCGV